MSARIGAVDLADDRAETGRSGRWVVVRQDVHGSRFDVRECGSQAEAQALIDEYESGYPHHQTYFLEPRGG